MNDDMTGIEELDLDEDTTTTIHTPTDATDELELNLPDAEELEVEEVAEEAPKTKRTRKAAAPKADKEPAAPASEFTSAWLARTVTEQTGVDIDARGLRVLLRKLAKDGSISREVGTDRTRYDFSGGLENATVKAVIAAVKSPKAEKVVAAPAEDAPAKKAAPRKAAPKATDGEATPTRRRRPAKAAAAE